MREIDGENFIRVSNVSFRFCNIEILSQTINLDFVLCHPVS